MSPIDPYLGAQAPTQDFLKAFLDREIPAGLLFYAPFWPQTGNQAWGADKRIVVPTTEVVDADGSYFAKDGLIRRARANSLRMENLGGLIEGARTNLQVRSEEFDNVLWLKLNVTIIANNTTAPDGAATADRLTETVINNLHLARSLSLRTAGQVYTLTAYAKRGAVRDWIYIYGDDGGAERAFFNINTGVVGTIVGPTATARIERLPNDWFRCILTWTETGTGNRHCGVGLASADNVWNYLGSTSAYCWFWGAQVENATFASSYIPTVAAAVVRAQENIQYAGAGHIEAATGTIFCAITSESTAALSDTASPIIIDTRVVLGANGTILYLDRATDRLIYNVQSGGAAVCSISSLAALVANTTYVIAYTWATNNFYLYLDGNLQGSDLAGAAPAAHGIIRIGLSLVLGLHSFINIAHFAIYNRAMSAPEIEQRSRFLHNQMARAS